MCHLSTQAVGFIWNFLNGCLSWLGRLFRHGFVECLYVRIGDGELLFLLGRRVRFIGVFSGFDCLHDPNSMVFSEFDPSSNLRVNISPDLT
jgi:hypothetical protein